MRFKYTHLCKVLSLVPGRGLREARLHDALYPKLGARGFRILRFSDFRNMPYTTQHSQVCVWGEGCGFLLKQQH